jgi:hypothetical protein
MIRLHTLMRIRNIVLASAAVALGAGCTGRVYAGPPNVQAQTFVAAPAQDDGAVVYVAEPPVVDVESYPMAFYGGFNVYYVDGRWYQRSPRGWAYYRDEPSELGRQRQERWGQDHDPRWGDARGADRQGRQDQGAPASQRRGVTEAQPPDRRAPPPPPPAQTVQPRREEMRPSPAPTAQPHRQEVRPPPPAATIPRRTPPVMRKPAHAPTPTQTEHR